MQNQNLTLVSFLEPALLVHHHKNITLLLLSIYFMRFVVIVSHNDDSVMYRKALSLPDYLLRNQDLEESKYLLKI